MWETMTIVTITGYLQNNERPFGLNRGHSGVSRKVHGLKPMTRIDVHVQGGGPVA